MLQKLNIRLSMLAIPERHELSSHSLPALFEPFVSYLVLIFIQRPYLDCKITMLLTIRRKGRKTRSLCLSRVSFCPYGAFLSFYTVTVLFLSHLQKFPKLMIFSNCIAILLNGNAKRHSTIPL